MNIRNAWLTVAFVLGVGAAPSSAQKVETPTLASPALGAERTVDVRLPASYGETDTRRYPVLYLLDGNSNLDYAVSVGDFLAENGKTPEMIVVAIPSGATRRADYAPEYVSLGGGPGGADDFLRYVGDELIPWVDGAYRTAPLRVLSGHSLGGAFVTYAMLERPELFHGYLAQSPFYEPQVMDALLARAEDGLSQVAEHDVFFYMNLGAEPDLEPGFERMKTALAATDSESFRWHSAAEPAETHMTTRLVGHYEGLSFLFAESWPLAANGTAPLTAADVREHRERLSARYGYDVLLSEQFLQQATQGTLVRGDMAATVALALLYSEQYPPFARGAFPASRVFRPLRRIADCEKLHPHRHRAVRGRSGGRTGWGVRADEGGAGAVGRGGRSGAEWVRRVQRGRSVAAC